MLSKIHRLTKSGDIQKVFSRGRRFTTPFFAFNWLPNTLNVARVAFVVGVKVGKRASTRNLIKRRAREVVRLHWGMVPIGFDFVITGRDGVVSYSKPKQEGRRTPHAKVAQYKEIEDQILSFFSKFKS